MSFITSKLLKDVSHGFGLGGYSLHDHIRPVRDGKASFFKTNQMHGDVVFHLTGRIDHGLKGTFPGDESPQENENIRRIEADAFITNEPHIVCFVRTADCVPILMHDPVKRAVAAVHSGWKGTSLNIVAKTVERMEKEFGSRRSDIRAAIGPSISGECYEVGEDVLKFFVPGAKGRGRLDLPHINHRLLLEAGVKDIEIVPVCNHCDPRFASYRRDRSETTRQVNFIMLE